MNVVIYQLVVPPYRVPLFRRLAKADGIDLQLVTGSRVAAIDPDDTLQVVSTRTWRGFSDRIVWISDEVGPERLEPGDVIILSGNPRILSNYPLIARARRRGVALIWWGHAWSSTSNRATAWIRWQLMRRLPHVVLVYSEAERQLLIQHGFAADRVFAAGNTIDERIVDQAIQSWPTERLEAFARDRGLGNRSVMLFSGRLTRKARLDLALRAMRIICARRSEILLVVIGDGEERSALEELARRSGLDSEVLFLGEMTDERQLAPWFLLARCFVYPGSVGLSLNHAFAYGLPAVIHDRPKLHMPEHSALRHGENGLVFRHGSAEDLAVQVLRLIDDQPLRSRLSREAFDLVRTELSMDRMVERFVSAIRCAAALKLRGAV